MTPQNVLTGLLAVQIALAALTWWPRGGDAAPSVPALPFPAADVTAVTVVSTSNRTRDPLTLAKQGDGWAITSAWGYPADPAKVTSLLDDLAAIRLKRPVATKAANHEALHVADGNASRTVTLAAGDQEVVLHLGVASHDRSYLRKGGDDDVYEVQGFGAWSVKDASTGYFDTEVLDVDAASLDTWTLTNPHGTVALTRGADGLWTTDGLPEGAVLPQDAVGKLLTETLSLSATGPGDPAAAGPIAVEVSWSAAGEDGTSTPGGYRATVDDAILLVTLAGATHPVVVQTPATITALTDTTLETLLTPPEG